MRGLRCPADFPAEVAEVPEVPEATNYEDMLASYGQVVGTWPPKDEVKERKNIYARNL